jgi:hypothetical protein
MSFLYIPVENVSSIAEPPRFRDSGKSVLRTRLGRFSPKVLADTVFLAELVNATAAIDDFLLACVKRVARGAHFNQEILTEGRAGCELVATTTGDFDVVVIGMYFGFHFSGSPERATTQKGRVGYREAAVVASPYFLSTEPVDKTVDEN